MKGGKVAHSVWLLAISWITEGLEFEPRLGKIFSLLHVVQTVSEAHPDSHPVGSEGSFLGVKGWGGGGDDHSPSTRAKIKKTWTHICTLIHLHGKLKKKSKAILICLYFT
jgi:hypothetical protein